MIKYEVLYKEVKEILSERRFKHSKGVVERALEYAKICGLEEENVKLVAIAHDIAKELTEEENQKYINLYNIQLDETEKMNKKLIHAKVGAYICKNKYNFTEEMADAVRYHTTGRENMTMIEKVIYLADATEKNRNYDMEPYVETIKKDINKGIVDVSKWVINKLVEKEDVIHLDTIKCYNYYLNKEEC